MADANPTVVANAVAALGNADDDKGSDDVMGMSSAKLQKLLAALNECTEWGQVSILDALAKYVPEEAKDAERIIERVMPRLQHANSAVVLSAIKVILQYMHEALDPESELCVGYRKKLSPPLVTMVGCGSVYAWRVDGVERALRVDRRPRRVDGRPESTRVAPSARGDGGVGVVLVHRPGYVAPSRAHSSVTRRSTPPSPSSPRGVRNVNLIVQEIKEY